MVTPPLDTKPSFFVDEFSIGCGMLSGVTHAGGSREARGKKVWSLISRGIAVLMAAPIPPSLPRLRKCLCEHVRDML